jgi:hypothetical protein
MPRVRHEKTRNSRVRLTCFAGSPFGLTVRENPLNLSHLYGVRQGVHFAELSRLQLHSCYAYKDTARSQQALSGA